MRLLIQTQGLLLSREDRDQIRARIQQAFARFGNQATGATLHLQDINGPRGGQDKDCQLIIELEDSTAVISDRGADLKAVINRAIHRAVQTIRRQLQHRQMSTRERVSLRAMEDRHTRQPRRIKGRQLAFDLDG